MHRPLRLAQRERGRLRDRLGHASRLKLERRLGDRLEQGMVVDPHLDAPSELIGVEIAGDRDHRRAIEEGAANAGREIGRARPQGRDAKPRRASHAAGDVGGEAGGAFMRGEHEFDPALAHRLHQRQHVAARNAEAAGHAVRLQRCDDQIGVVHAGSESRAPSLVWRWIASSRKRTLSSALMGRGSPRSCRDRRRRPRSDRRRRCARPRSAIVRWRPAPTSRIRRP